jgi:GTP-binding protein
MSEALNKEKIRNVAIIAHVDHGKTTLVDAIMKQSNLFRDNQEEMGQEQILDKGELEREKGITILAKNISIRFKGYKINIIDTPGHADFGGEVERTLNMADGCVLVVDAQEGVMPQTRVVLKRAMELGLKPIVVVNKIDKKLANIASTVDKIQTLFLDLAQTEDQLDFPVLYAVAREGKVFTMLPTGDLFTPDKLVGDVSPLLDLIVKTVPSPKGEINGPFQMQVCSIEYDEHLGRRLIGRISRGVVSLNDPIILLPAVETGKKEQGRVKKLLVKEGLDFIEVESAPVGEIIALIGLDINAIGGTICDLNNPEALPTFKISPPSVSIKFEANTSPLVGKDGKFVTAKLLQKRLEKEIETNVSLEIRASDGSSYVVAGRGELQLSILIETMRREGFEFQVRKPEVILKQIDGKMHEPLDTVFVDVPEASLGIVTAELSRRGGTMKDMKSEGGRVYFEYEVLTRNIFGLRNHFMTETKGLAVFNTLFNRYVKTSNTPSPYRKGVILSAENGVTRGYALNMVQERGELFTGAGEEVYQGMIVGLNKYEGDMDVNPCKERHKTSVRMSHAEVTLTELKAVKQLTLEYALSFLAEDEVLEVTPLHLRLRKVFLSKTEREWSKRKNLSEFAKKQMGIAQE